jgi:hypothetical protein
MKLYWFRNLVQYFRSGICDGINRCNIFFVHAAVLSIKTAFNLVKIHLLSHIIPLIQWSVMFCRPCFNRFGGLKYIPRLLPMFQLVLCWEFKKLRMELIYWINTIAFVYRWILLLEFICWHSCLKNQWKIV